MPSTYSTRIRAEKQADGENSNTWGSRFNSNTMDMIDAAIGGMASYALSGAKTLTSNNGAADEARMMFQNITSGTGGTVTIPNVEKAYLVRNASSGDVIFTTGSGTTATVLTGNTQWVVCTGGNIVYTAAVPNFAGQLAFPATQNPSADVNTLDDYEEGTFTPTLTFGGASVGMSYFVQTGRYTKVGRLVDIDVYIALNAKGSSTGAAKVAGLPFTSNGSNPFSAGAWKGVSLTTVSVPVYEVDIGTTTISLGDFTGSTTADLNDTDFNATTSLIKLSASYHAT